MAGPVRVQVLLSRDEAEQFDNHCLTRGFKKSTLIARLVGDDIDREEHYPQHELFEGSSASSGGNRS